MRFARLLLISSLMGCAPALHLTRSTPPEASLGNVRTLSVSVSTDVARTWKSLAPPCDGVPVEEMAGVQPSEFTFATQ